MAIHKSSLAYKVMAPLVPRLVTKFERAIALASGNRTFYPLADYPWTKEIEREWPAMQRELQALLKPQRAKIPEFKNISEQQGNITQGEWRTFMLYVYGYEVAANCALCPETARIVKQIPGMSTALFSVLAPGARLTPHRGPYKGVLRYHLALIVPPDHMSCGIRVGSDTRHWREGESMVFDDTHDHAAWNHSDQTRAVLFVDFARKLPFPLHQVNRSMIKLIGISPFVQEMMTNLNDRVSDVK
jgi:ornithine lipid ester-linked acyl 2-hydroxylase